MIIIKTQKNSIIKTNRIQINGDAGTSIMIVTKETGIQTIADYKSHERAKEVMEEIEEHIRERYNLETVKTFISDIVSMSDKNANDCIDEIKSSAIFTMPKE